MRVLMEPDSNTVVLDDVRAGHVSGHVALIHVQGYGNFLVEPRKAGPLKNRGMYLQQLPAGMQWEIVDDGEGYMVLTITRVTGNEC